MNMFLTIIYSFLSIPLIVVIFFNAIHPIYLITDSYSLLILFFIFLCVGNWHLLKKISAPGKTEKSWMLKMVVVLSVLSYAWMIYFYYAINTSPEHEDWISKIFTHFFNTLGIAIKIDYAFLSILGFTVFAKIFIRLRRNAIDKYLFAISTGLFYLNLAGSIVFISPIKAVFSKNLSNYFLS